MRVKSPALLATVALLALAGCGEKKADDAAAMASDAATVAADAAAGSATARSEQAGPGIDGTVAPGVAFTYNYAFTLPAKAISGVQREHAAACERLGTSRCRVTGMNFEQPDKDSVSAKLDFLLAPDLAHRFASEGIAAVERAEGKLDNASVNGQNAGDAIVLSQEDSAAIGAEVARLEARLKAKGLGDGERRDVETRLSELRGQLRDEEHGRRENEKAIATTPVSFSYASEGLIGSDSGFGQALATSWSGVTSTFGFILVLAGILLPWLVLIGAGVFAVRWLRARRLLNATSPAEPTPTP